LDNLVFIILFTEELILDFKNLEKIEKLEKLLNMLALLKDTQPICDRFFSLIVDTGPEIDDGILHFIYQGIVKAGEKKMNNL